MPDLAMAQVEEFIKDGKGVQPGAFIPEADSQLQGATETLRVGFSGKHLKLGTLKFLVFTGSYGAGSCTLTGAVAGDVVAGIIDLTTPGNVTLTDFESVITVDNEIQQLDAANLSAVDFAVILVAE